MDFIEAGVLSKLLKFTQMTKLPWQLVRMYLHLHFITQTDK